MWRASAICAGSVSGLCARGRGLIGHNDFHDALNYARTAERGGDDLAYLGQTSQMAFGASNDACGSEAALPRAKTSPSCIMRNKLRTGDNAFRKSYLRLFIDRIEVDDEEVRIRGSRQALEYAVSNQSAVREGKVPSFVQDWRPQRDSNPCCHLERVES